LKKPGSGRMMNMKVLDACFCDSKWMKREEETIFAISANISFIKGKSVHACYKI